jgi:hypothetical protein
MAACPSAAAHIRAVCPRRSSFASTRAPCDKSAWTAAGAPVRAAVMSGVSPPGKGAFGSAPAFKSSSTIGPLPFVHANESGVTP